MTLNETTGDRDLTYSAWHRVGSTRRFVGIENAQRLAMIDIDVAVWVEYDDHTKMPIAIIETAEDNGSWKSATVTKNLAIAANIPAICALYTRADTRNPHNARYPDIASFRVRRLNPDEQDTWATMTPKEYAHMLLRMRTTGANTLDRAIA